MRIEFNSTVPSILVERTRPLIEQYSIILPSWVEEVRVSWDPTDETGAAALISSYEEYQWVKLVLHQGSITADNSTYAEYVRHELCHPMLQRTKEVQYDLLEALDLENTNPALYRWACREIHKANEKATQAMCEAIARIESIR